MLDTIANWFTGALNYAGDTWTSAVNGLKTKAVEFIGLYKWLESRASIAARDPQLQSEYANTMQRGRQIKATVEKTTGGIDWINGKLLRVGTSLNALPIIPVALTVATITGLIAAMTYWLADAYKLKTKLLYMEQHGFTNTEAAAVMGQSGTDAIIAVAAIGGVLWLLLRGEK
jgi:hypothetical protein